VQRDAQRQPGRQPDVEQRQAVRAAHEGGERPISPTASTTPSSRAQRADQQALQQEHPLHLARVAPIARRMPISRRFCTTDTTSTLAMPSTTTTITTARISRC
jgi:hypothetical protein